MSTPAPQPLFGTDLITRDMVDQYQQDGVIFIKQALHPDWLMLLEMGLQRVMANALQQKHLFYAGEDREFIETVRNFDITPEVQRLMYDSPIADMIGKLIGRRTWGGLVGISGNPALIDGGRISVPTFAFYDNDGEWLIEGWGVQTRQVCADRHVLAIQDASDLHLLSRS